MWMRARILWPNSPIGGLARRPVRQVISLHSKDLRGLQRLAQSLLLVQTEVTALDQSQQQWMAEPEMNVPVPELWLTGR